MLRKCQAKELDQSKALCNALDIHGETFLSVAFARSFDVEKWNLARSAARILVTALLKADIADVLENIMNLVKLLVLAQRPGGIAQGNIHSLSIRQPMWKKLYSTVQTDDPDGIETLISLVSKIAHVDFLTPKPFDLILSLPPAEGCLSAETALSEVNRSLLLFRDGFLSSITRYADFNVSTAALELLRRPSVVKHVMIILLSPIEDLQVAAQILVGLAFDVDARQECLRALLENVPGEALEGIFEFLSTFQGYAPVMPEACNLSKSLVRCFTDIIEVLCATPNGLLHSEHFLSPKDDKGPAANLLRLWNMMTTSLTVIFKRTPQWAPYFDNEEMVVWMRDALIFGRDMLATWRVIENAANSRSPDMSRRGRLSSIGKKMVNGLQDVLPELTRWLRLTDEELLHQSFSLLTTLLDCFRDAGIAPTEEATQRLRKNIDNARKAQAEPSLRSRLDSTMLLTLEAALDDFEDVVEIIPPPMIASSSRPMPSVLVKTKDVAPSKTQSTSSVKMKAPSLPSLSVGSSSTSMKSVYFTNVDQQKLDATSSMPTFRRTGKAPLLTKPLPPKPSGRDSSSHPVPKFEGQRQVAQPVSSSSDESESDSEEESKTGLATLAKLQRSPKIKKPAERRQIMTMDLPIQSNPIQERLKRREETRNATFRLNPDISGLHKVLLSWDYEHTGSGPPGDKVKYQQVPDTFVDHNEYKKVFEPLLMLDLWAQIVQAKGELQDTVECKITSRQFSDRWIDLDVSFTGNLKKEWYLTDTDLVVLKHPNSKKAIMVKTMSYKSTPFGPQQGSQACLRCFADTDPGLQINTTWQLNKLLK